jgi:hypothetical protein
MADSIGIERLLQYAATSDTVERGAADPAFALDILAGLDADYVLYAASKGDWATAMTLSYDRARKAVSMLLMANGWRVPDQPGKHARIADVVEAWLGGEDGNGPRLADSYARSRKARNNHEYPDSRAPLPDDAALRQLTLDNMRLVHRARLELGLPSDDTIVPTEDNIRRWRPRL